VNPTSKPPFPIPDNIPAELRALKRWCGFKLVWNGAQNKFKKPPFSPVDGSGIGAIEKYIDHFLTFDEALAGAEHHHLDGVGFVFVDGDGYVGVDFDHCLTDGNLDAEVKTWLQWFPSFKERSISGTGIHIICKGNLAKSVSTPFPNAPGVTVELYSYDRFFTVSGDRAGDTASLFDCQQGIDRLLKHLGQEQSASGVGRNDGEPKEYSVEQAVTRLNKACEQFAKMSDGRQAAATAECYWFGRVLGGIEKQPGFADERFTFDMVKGRITHALEQTNWPRQKFEVIERQLRLGMADPLTLVTEKDKATNAAADLDTWLRGEVEYASEEVCNRAALLSEMELEDRYARLVKKLGWKKQGLLRTEVEKRRPKSDDEDDEFQGSVVTIADTEPWPEPVDGVALLDEMAALARRYVHFHNPSDADAGALYVLGTHCFDCFDLFPFFGITAPAEDSGKTTLEKWFGRLVARPLPTSNITPAALFRLIAMFKGTLLIDEMDTFLNPDSELYGILNSGHDREMAFVTRTVGDDHEPRNFSTWCPRIWAMIGLPQRTVVSRSIMTRLLRKPPGEQLERLPKPRRMGPEWERLRRQCARWAADHEKEILATEIDVAGLVNRASDNWEPLFVLAQVAGGEWPKKVREAAGVPNVINEEAANTKLLRDIRNIFHTRKATLLPCAVLTQDLCRQKESPWPHYDHNNELNVSQLGTLLGSLGIRSKPFRLNKQMALDLGLPGWTNKSTRGFALDQFTALFNSYLAGEEAYEVEVTRAGPEQEVFG
jgi:hypothetical protein